MSEIDVLAPLDWQSWVPQPYTAQLLGWPDLPAAARIAAEVRFISELERRLGGPAAVEQAFWEDFAKLEELGHSDSKRVSVPVSRWTQAEAEATAAGFKELTAPVAATFWLSMFDSVLQRPDAGS